MDEQEPGLVDQDEVWATSATFVVTPSIELPLGSTRTEGMDWLGAIEPLEVNMLVVWLDQQADPLVLVSMDTLYVGDDIRNAVLAACGSIPAENIWTFATHTHRGPMLDRSKPRLGSVDETYLSDISNQIRDCLTRLLLTHPESVRIEFGVGHAAHSINRRLRWPFVLAKRPRFFEVVHGPNFSGATDENISVLSLRRADGTLFAVLWSYACHPVGPPWMNGYSAHFPHVVRTRIRATEASSQVPVLFAQGFSGNVRPSATASGARGIDRRPRFTDMSQVAYAEWTGSLADRVAEVISTSKDLVASHSVSKRVLVEGHLVARKLNYPVVFQSLTIGDQLTLVGVSAEPVVEYVEMIRKLAPTRDVVCIGCIDTPFGYLPTNEIRKSGGYEGGGFARSFSLGRLRSNIQQIALRGFRDVLS